MKVLLTFEFKDIAEAQEYLARLQLPLPTAAATLAAAPEMPPAPPVVSGKAKKAAKPAPAEKQVTHSYTLDDVRAKLSALFDAKGRAPVADILKNAGAHSVSDLSPELFVAVIMDAEKAMAS